MDKIVKLFDLTIKEYSQDDDSNTGYISGMASTFNNSDRVGDIMMSGAFKRTLKDYKKRNKTIPLLYSHSYNSLIGGIRPDAIKETPEGLEVIKGEIDLDTQQGRDCYSLAKKNYLSSFSIGFYPTSDGYQYMKEGGRKFHDVDLHEVSLVPVPANQEANLTEVKTVPPANDYPLADTDTAWDASKARKNIKKATDSEEKISAAYKKCFMYYDPDEADTEGGYKLPYVDLVDGRLKVIPKAIYAIAGVLRGARGGVDIPDADKSKIKSRIKEYYKKLGKDDPFDDDEKSFQEDDSVKFELLKSMVICNSMFNNLLKR